MDVAAPSDQLQYPTKRCDGSGHAVKPPVRMSLSASEAAIRKQRPQASGGHARVRCPSCSRVVTELTAYCHYLSARPPVGQVVVELQVRLLMTSHGIGCGYESRDCMNLSARSWSSSKYGLLLLVYCSARPSRGFASSG